MQWAERLAGELEVSVLITTARGGGSADRAALSGVVGEASPRSRAGSVRSRSSGSRRTRSTSTSAPAATPASVPVRSSAIDFTYQIDLEKCKAHRECVKACGAVHGDRLRARGPRAQRALRPRARPLARAGPEDRAEAAGLSCAGPRSARAGARRGRARAARRRVREAEVLRLRRADLRPRPVGQDRLHEVHRRLLDGRDRFERRQGQGRAAPLRGLRRVRDRLPVGRDDLREPARGRARRAAEAAARGVRPGRRQGRRDPVPQRDRRARADGAARATGQGPARRG